MTQFSGIIFDMDGTLVDSEGTWEVAQQAMFDARGVAWNDEVRQQIIGLRLDDGMQRVVDALDLDTTADDLVDDLMARMLELIPQRVEAKPGAQALIDYVAALDVPYCVASSSPLPIINATLQAQGWAAQIPQVYSANSVPNGKPAPDVYFYAADKLNVTAEACLAIEDSPNGARAAVAAGMTCYVVPDFHSSHAAFADITPHTFDDLHAVIAALQGE